MSDRLDGHDAIRKYIDPTMSTSYYFTKVRPQLENILFLKTYARRQRGNKPKYFTYTNLIQLWLLRVNKV